jgi:hypothetical protein
MQPLVPASVIRRGGEACFVRDGGWRANALISLLRWGSRTIIPGIPRVIKARSFIVDPNVAGQCAATNMSRGETPTLGVKLWIEPKKNTWSTNSAKSSQALALLWLHTTQV